MIIVRRWLDSNKVRQMCINYGYYTRGDCKAYDHMLSTADMVDANDLPSVMQIAIDIYDHSNMRDDREYAKKDWIEGLMYGLLKECVEMYVELEGVKL